ncbi:MAG: methylenetetrahydrofolate reductase [Desulfobacteraceae bacterium]
MDKLRQGLAGLPEGDKQALGNFGIDYALEQCRELLQVGVPSLHFYTMNRSQSTAAVISGLRRQGLL